VREVNLPVVCTSVEIATYRGYKIRISSTWGKPSAEREGQVLLLLSFDQFDFRETIEPAAPKPSYLENLCALCALAPAPASCLTRSFCAQKNGIIVYKFISACLDMMKYWCCGCNLVGWLNLLTGAFMHRLSCSFADRPAHKPTLSSQACWMMTALHACGQFRGTAVRHRRLVTDRLPLRNSCSTVNTPASRVQISPNVCKWVDRPS